MNSRIVRIAASLGFLGVAMGAFGAHGLNKILAAYGQVANWQTAVQYQLVHAVAMLALALTAPGRIWACRLWLIGIILFSGSLYVIGLTNIRIIGAFVTPTGGLFLLAGWAALLASPRDAVRKPAA